LQSLRNWGVVGKHWSAETENQESGKMKEIFDYIVE
jgi:hypothetical protein